MHSFAALVSHTKEHFVLEHYTGDLLIWDQTWASHCTSLASEYLYSTGMEFLKQCIIVITDQLSGSWTLPGNIVFGIQP